MYKASLLKFFRNAKSNEHKSSSNPRKSGERKWHHTHSTYTNITRAMLSRVRLFRRPVTLDKASSGENNMVLDSDPEGNSMGASPNSVVRAAYAT